MSKLFLDFLYFISSLSEVVPSSSITLVALILKPIITIPTRVKSRLMVYIPPICRWDINTNIFEALHHLYWFFLDVIVGWCLGCIAFYCHHFVLSTLTSSPLYDRMFPIHQVSVAHHPKYVRIT